MENLIENAHTLFDERLPPSSPPLPPTPAGDPVPVISYGSSRTKIALPQSGDAQVADFTPQLPSRPTGSIHPSARCNPPMSPSLLSGTSQTQSTSSLAPSLRSQVSADTKEPPTHEQVAPNTFVTEVAKRAPEQPQDSVPPPTATATREQYQEDQQSTTESIPETPLTASSLASSSLGLSE